MPNEAKQSELSSLARISGVVLMLLAFFLTLSRISFDPYDLEHFSSPAQRPVHNLGGMLGAKSLFYLLMSFGEAFWWVPFLMMTWSLQLSLGLAIFWRRGLGALMIGLSVLSVLFDHFSSSTPDWSPSYGGVFGAFYGKMLIDQIGPGGTWMILGVSAAFLPYLLQLKEVVHAISWPRWSEVIRVSSSKSEKPQFEEAQITEVEHSKSSVPEVPRVVKRRKADVEPSRLDVNEESIESEGENSQPAIVALPQPRVKPAQAADGAYLCPELDVLRSPVLGVTDSDNFMEQRARSLESMFMSFKLRTTVVGMVRGPAITQFELSIDEGTRVNKITTLKDNIAMTLTAPSVRIVAPIPGKNTIGIEISNHKKEMVNLRSILDMPECSKKMDKMKLPLILGKDVVGHPLVEDLAKMPHLLVAGTTGSGKSVCINSIIVSLVLYNKPEQVRLLMIDPKMVEMVGYEGIPHLMRPVITVMDEAAGVLDWACRRMDERYAMLTRVKVRDIATYNGLRRNKLVEAVGGEENMEKMEWPMPYIVIIVDEFSDLMMTGAKEIESYITRLAQKSRAVGIHVILATQRPSVDVITGLIKTNMPSRIAFQVAAKIDSRTILDQNGADELMGKGDMLYMPSGGSALVRAQGVLVEDDEIANVVDHWKAQGEPEYVESESMVALSSQSSKSSSITQDDESQSDDFVKAVELVVESGRPSASYIQRQLRAGYNKASRYVELMETMGVVGPPKGAKGREVFWQTADIEKWKSSR